MTPEFENTLSQALGRIEQKVDDLAGPQGRIRALEDAQTRQWWFTVAVVPVISVFHAIARKFGIDV